MIVLIPASCRRICVKKRCQELKLPGSLSSPTSLINSFRSFLPSLNIHTATFLHLPSLSLSLLFCFFLFFISPPPCFLFYLSFCFNHFPITFLSLLCSFSFSLIILPFSLFLFFLSYSFSAYFFIYFLPSFFLSFFFFSVWFYLFVFFSLFIISFSFLSNTFSLFPRNIPFLSSLFFFLLSMPKSFPFFTLSSVTLFIPPSSYVLLLPCPPLFFLDSTHKIDRHLH
ncbi:unnamed protein product [Acanthosepion pharaonis]|uniref:Uncharacterized protein n=1 Tax=Acanthosepion pharaonis TaxID=158019 RepID=A0A812CD45_ACAPH|nr:unnamed protein product [Sepia pharaonis]